MEKKKSLYANEIRLVNILKTIIDKKIGVKIKFLTGKDKLLIELISPIGKKSPIKNLLNKKNYG